MPFAARVVVLPQNDSTLRVEEVELPDPGPDQVIVEQFASGICHSQLHSMHNPRKSALLLGHESTGAVLAKGSAVTHVDVGDHVMVSWAPRNPEEAMRAPELITVSLADGSVARNPVYAEQMFTWADRALVDQRHVIPMPASVATDVTAVVGCAVMTGAGAVYNTVGVKAGESVAIFGVGGVGLSAVAAAKVVEADPIIAVDLDDEKLEFARQFGASVLINASSSDAVAQIRDLTVQAGTFDALGDVVAGVDYAFDCIGVGATMAQIVPAARGKVLGATTGGTAVLVGVPQSPVELNGIDMIFNEKKFVASHGGSCLPERDFPMFLRWYQEGDLDLEAMVTERFGIDQINEATAALAAGKIAGRAILEF